MPFTIEEDFYQTTIVVMDDSVDDLDVCMIIENTGEYEGYVAEPRACEWDIAAGHAILKHAGGTVTDFDDNEVLYGKKDFKNPSLILKGKDIL